jgi:hypothetical protein
MGNRIVNGVNVETVENTIKAVKEDTDIANFKFRLNNKWIGGGYNQSTVGPFFGAKKENFHTMPFKWDADESPLLTGEDRGANPVEHPLNALSACMTTSLVYHAACGPRDKDRRTGDRTRRRHRPPGITGSKQRGPERVQEHPGQF